LRFEITFSDLNYIPSTQPSHGARVLEFQPMLRIP
jgi:hypothetical protein